MQQRGQLLPGESKRVLLGQERIRPLQILDSLFKGLGNTEKGQKQDLLSRINHCSFSQGHKNRKLCK